MNYWDFPIYLPPALAFLANPLGGFLINLVAWLAIALVVNFVVLRLLKVLTRRIPGELEDILLGILKVPIVILILLFGIRSSLHLLPLAQNVEKWERIVFLTILVLVITHVLGRLIKEVLVYYGEKWAARTESRLDDVLVPVLNIFGPLVLAIVAALVILPIWGVNITSVLLGAGVLGLVLGLALQETLGNIFSGISILVEAPFKKNDLILLPDGRVCEVIRLGIRSTTFFSLDEQATIYIPNKTLGMNTLVNLTKPTPEQRYNIDLRLSGSYNIAQIQNAISHIAIGHPSLLTSDMETKLVHVRELARQIRRKAKQLPAGDPAREVLLQEADRNERSMVKLDLDGKFNQQVFELKDALRNLIRGIGSRESNGLNEVERQELFCNYISPVQTCIDACLEASKNWQEAEDPWINHTDHWNQRKQWESRDEQLLLHWERLKKAMLEMRSQRELQLDDSTKLMLEWLEKEYKIPPGYWKNPVVVVKELDGMDAVVQLWYYVDNIRLEHDGRPRRVRNELNRMIQEMLVENRKSQA